MHGGLVEEDNLVGPPTEPVLVEPPYRHRMAENLWKAIPDKIGKIWEDVEDMVACQMKKLTRRNLR